MHTLKCSLSTQSMGYKTPVKKQLDISIGTVLFIELNGHLWSFSGTEEERIAVETACSYGSKAEAYSSPTAEDVSVEVTMDGEGPKMGGDAELTITLQNSSSEQRKVLLHSQVAVMYYTGVHKATVRKDRTDVDLVPNEGEWSIWSEWVVGRKCRFDTRGSFFITPYWCQQRSLIPLAA